MNIKDAGMWPVELPPDLQEPGEYPFVHLLDLRTKTYQGFAAIEEGKGILRPRMSLASPLGQEAFRILFARGIEEMWEAKYSHEWEHILEELIDSMNFVWSLLVLDPEHPPINELANDLYIAWLRGRDRNLEESIPWHPAELDPAVLRVIGNASFALEKLRNRAWQKNAQSVYFDGWHELRWFVAGHFEETSRWFYDWDQFVRFFIAKDNVLQFRLRTNY